MFVVVMVCIVGFGWVFTKVLNKQTDILGDIKLVLQTQVTTDTQRIAQNELVAASVREMALQLALHRQAVEYSYIPERKGGQNPGV